MSRLVKKKNNDMHVLYLKGRLKIMFQKMVKCKMKKQNDYKFVNILVTK